MQFINSYDQILINKHELLENDQLIFPKQRFDFPPYKLYINKTKIIDTFFLHL